METFRRYEKKYLLDEAQYLQLMEKLKDHVKQDKFFEANIRSIYYDTKKFELIRRSIEKPEYKEKLRVRSYNEPKPDDLVFVELKKKLDGIVYKRRTKAYAGEVLNDMNAASAILRSAKRSDMHCNTMTDCARPSISDATEHRMWPMKTKI